LLGCKTNKPIVAQPTSNLVLNKSESNTDLEKLIAPYKNGMANAMNKVIGFSPSFEEKRRPSSALGSFMCDAVYKAASDSFKNLNFCLLNYGGIRSTLDSGEVTIGEMYQLMPFENEIVVLKFENRYLDSIRSIANQKGGEPISRFKVQKEDNGKYFYMATNDYLANGGDNYKILGYATERYDLGLKIRDALIYYVRENKKIIFDHTHREL